MINPYFALLPLAFMVLLVGLYVIKIISISEKDILLILYSDIGKARPKIEILVDLNKQPRQFWQIRSLVGIRHRLERMEDDWLVFSDIRQISDIEITVNNLPPKEYSLRYKGQEKARLISPRVKA